MGMMELALIWDSEECGPNHKLTMTAVASLGAAALRLESTSSELEGMPASMLPNAPFPR